MYQVDCEDANFLFLEDADSPTHISLLALYEHGPADADVIRFQHIMQLVQRRLAVTPVFRQKIKRIPADLDYPYWVDDKRFDLDYHVRHLALPKPGDWRQFCIQVSRLHSRPLDIRRPLWELYVIEGLDKVAGLGNGGFALYLKVHHAAMDEFSAMELLESLHTTAPNPLQHEVAAQSIAYLAAREPGSAQVLFRAMVNNTLRTASMIRESVLNYSTVSKVVARFGVRMLGQVMDDAASSGEGYRFAGKLTNARVFDGIFVERKPFEDMVARVPGASLAHVQIMLCGEALRLYLLRHNDPLAAGSLCGLRQVNMRNAGAHAMVGNSIAIEEMNLFSNIANLSERLLALVCSLGEAEDAEQRGFKLRALYEHLPAPLHSLLGRYSNRRGSPSREVMRSGHLGFAELPGSARPLYLLSARLFALANISPLYSGCGLMFSASTYDTRIGLTFTADRSMMPDPQLMRLCLGEAYASLCTHLTALPARRSRKARQAASAG
jgi:WS/DGAT/MGAT family acyltransferase